MGELEGGAEGFALFAEVDGCAQVARLEDDTKAWVDALESGASCAACEARFSVIAEAGLLVHAPPEPSAGPAQLRLGKIECGTLTRTQPRDDTPPSSVRLWRRELPVRPENPIVSLRFHHGAYSSWASETDSEVLLEAVSELFAASGIQVVLDASSDRVVPESLPWYEGDPSALEPLTSPDDGVVDVVFAGCLEHVHPELGTRSTLDGLVPRIPAQGSPGAGIFLRGRACTAASLGPAPTSLDSQSRILAHELGHYLGLYHAPRTPEEAEAAEGLDDAGDDNLMHANPALILNPVFSPAQAERMRLHAALLGEPMPDR